MIRIVGLIVSCLVLPFWLGWDHTPIVAIAIYVPVVALSFSVGDFGIRVLLRNGLLFIGTMVAIRMIKFIVPVAAAYTVARLMH